MLTALLGSANDPQIRHLANALKSEGVNFFIADTADFGNKWSLSYDPDFDDGLIHFDDEESRVNAGESTRVAFSTIYSAYWHEYRAMTAPVDNEEANKCLNIASSPALSGDTQWLEQERSSALQCWFYYDSIKWVNSIDAVRLHQCKAIQLRKVANLGANIPYSFIGNSPTVAAQFCSNMKHVIYKPVRGGKTAQHVIKQPNMRALFSTVLAQRPVTLQKYIAGTNVRSYVLGEDVLSVQIDSHEPDYRNDRYAKLHTTIIAKPIKQLAIRICKTLGMQWCAIDWRKSAKGTFFFLEANPCPFYLKVEKETGHDITGRLVRLLTS